MIGEYVYFIPFVTDYFRSYERVILNKEVRMNYLKRAKYFNVNKQLLSMVASSLVLLIIAVLILVALYRLLRNPIHLVVNAILGIIILFLAHFIGIHVPIDLIAVLISAIAGIPGAILLIILSLLGISL